MEIFISGSQVCEKKNILGLGALRVLVSMSQALLGGGKSGLVSARRALWQWGKCFPAGDRRFPSTAFAPSEDMSWVWVRASQESQASQPGTSLGYPHPPPDSGPSPAPIRQDQMGRKLSSYFFHHPSVPLTQSSYFPS